MIYGEVTYTGISGTNMDSGIMAAAEITGSSGDAPATGGQHQTITLTWTYPGGITNVSWAYALWTKSENAAYGTDADVRERCGLPAEAFNEITGELSDESRKQELENYLNDQTYFYLVRLLTPGMEGDYTEFSAHLGNCINVNM